MGSSSLIRDQTQDPCIGNTESYLKVVLAWLKTFFLSLFCNGTTNEIEAKVTGWELQKISLKGPFAFSLTTFSFFLSEIWM